jgi:hypothetical protein
MAIILTKRTEPSWNMRPKRKRRPLKTCGPVVMEDRQRHGNHYLEMPEMENRGSYPQLKRSRKNCWKGDGEGYSINLDDVYDIDKFEFNEAYEMEILSNVRSYLLLHEVEMH